MSADWLVILRAGASEAAIAPGAGGSIAYYRTATPDGVIDWLRPATSEDIAARNARGMGCYPLIPYSNRIRNGRFAFGGREIRLPPNNPGHAHPLHGHGWQTAWQVTQAQPQTATIVYLYAGGSWPFPYGARQTFTLDERGLTAEIALTNHGRTPMPAGLGLHPYFPRAARTRLTAQVAQMWATDSEVMPTALVAPPGDRQLGEGVLVDRVAMGNGFTGWNGLARIEWPERRAALSIHADPPFSFLVVYTPPGQAFFCAEPVSHCTDAFNLAAQGRNDTGMATLAPGATLTGRARFAIAPPL